MPETKSLNLKTTTFDADSLSGAVAKRILADLLELQPELVPVVSSLAEEAQHNPRMEDLARKILKKLKRISEGDIYMKSGRRSGSYKEPEEAAAEVLSEVMEPYFERLEKLLGKKSDKQAEVRCQAMLLALYEFQRSDNFEEYAEYAEEFPEETADWAARLWRTAGDIEKAGNKKFVAGRVIAPEFVNQHTPEWQWLLSE